MLCIPRILIKDRMELNTGERGEFTTFKLKVSRSTIPLLYGGVHN